MTLMIVIVAGLMALGVIIYNRLVRDRNRVDAAWSDIDVQLQRRHDLIPQLVKAVDQYAGYERTTIEAVTTLRAEAMQLNVDSDAESRGVKEEELAVGLQRLIAVAENYPDLKANENFLNLQNQLVETENYLQFARRFFNGSVRQLNTRIETVPNNFLAGFFSFKQKVYFQKTSDDAANVPLVNLGSVE
ncbi:MAG: LemA protein [Woeseiaceae bacterium]|jgi:LemA protein